MPPGKENISNPTLQALNEEPAKQYWQCVIDLPESSKEATQRLQGEHLHPHSKSVNEQSSGSNNVAV